MATQMRLRNQRLRMKLFKTTAFPFSFQSALPFRNSFFSFFTSTALKNQHYKLISICNRNETSFCPDSQLPILQSGNKEI